MSRFFIDRPIFAAVISIVIMLVGGLALLVLPIARYPEIAPPTVNVNATYPGANAKTVGETVATPIEQEVNGVDGMLFMTSTSSNDGTMDLNVTFEVGTDLDMANVLVQNRVSLATPKLPEEVKRQGVAVKKKAVEITLLISLYSPGGALDPLTLSNFATQRIRDELTRVPGVGDVIVFGAGDYGMRIWLDPDKLKVRGLTTNDVVNAVREQNVEVAAGQIGAPPAPKGQAFQFTVNTLGRLTSVDQFENIVVRTGAQGQLTYVRDVARVELGSKSYDVSSTFNGEDAAAIMVYQLPGANAIAVAEGVRAKMIELAERFPEGLVYEVPYDSTTVINASIAEVQETLFITLILVVLTVFIFLQNFRATLIPAATIPVSLIGTFAVMAVLGYSINLLTMFGLVLVIGIVVDDAIVVVENITRHLDEGGVTPKEAAKRAMDEVSGPVIATTLVLLSVFVPTAFMGGITGRLFQQFSVTISVATIFSSINALTLSPALGGILLRPTPQRGFILFRLFNAALGNTTNVYLWFVRTALRRAFIALVLFAGLVVAAGYGFAGLPTGFVPAEDEGYCYVNGQLPDAASLQRAEAVGVRIDELARSIPGVRDCIVINGYSFLDGSRASNSSSAIVVYENWDQRPGKDLHAESIVRKLNASFRSVLEANVFAFSPPSLPGLGVSGGFAVQLQDRTGAGLEALQEVAADMAERGTAQTGIASMYSSFRANVPQLFLEIDREQVKEMGIPLQDVFSTLQAYLGSAYVNDFNDFGRIYQVKAQAEAGFRAKPDDILQLEVRAPNGAMVPMAAILDVTEVLGPQTVGHFNIYPAAKMTGGAAPGTSSGQAMDLVEQMFDAGLPESMGYAWTDISFQQKAAQGGTTVIFLLAVIMVYLVLAAQYESWTIPVSVCLAVPTALLGATVGLLARGLDNNVYTQIGIVLLIGLSSKSAILIVEFAKVEREGGKSAFDAAVEASKMRFRAVLMTAFSFILGVIPLLVATGAGSASRQVLGTVVFSGMCVATVVSVVTVPLLYLVVQRMAERLGGGRTAAPAPAPDSEPGTG